MTIDHRVRDGDGHLLRGRPVLRLMGQDADAIRRQVLHQPGVVNVEPLITIAGPAVPRRAPGPTLDGGTCSTDEALHAAGRTRRVVASVPSFTTLVDLVRRSDCCSVLPYRLVRDEPGLVVIEPPLAVPGFTKVLVWHERTQADPAMRWIRRQLAAVQA